MRPRSMGVASAFGVVARLMTAGRSGRRDRRRAGMRPAPEALERRLALDGSVTTYTWTALGNGSSFSDPNNWSHAGPLGGGVGVPGTPSPGSNLAFPPISWLPANSPTTINFNGTNGTLPFNLMEIGDSYTFTGNTVALTGGLVVANPVPGNPTSATILLSNVILSRQATIYTQQDSSLTIGGAAAGTTGVQIILQGGVTKTGGGRLAIDTSSITDPLFLSALQTFEIAAGTVSLGTSMDFSGSLFQVDANAGLQVAAGAAVSVGSLSGSGGLVLQGTGAAGDTTGLTVSTPLAQSDRFTGPITGVGQLAKQGPGTLTLVGIDFGIGGAVDVAQGTLDVNGPIAAGSLQVGAATFGGLGSWHFSGPVTFQSGSVLDVSLAGLPPGTQSSQLVSGDTATGINLGNATLAGTVGYEYQAGDAFTIVSAPTVAGVFQNTANGQVSLGGVPFSVAYSGTSVVLTALQSETTTRLTTSGAPSHPGQPVTFTAAVNTRTTPVTTGTVRFEIGGAVVATEPLTADGTASFTTASLPLGGATITAVFDGSGDILGSNSPSLTQLVVPYSTATVVTSSANPARFRQPVTLIATVTADGQPVTSGAVTFTRGNIVIGVAALGPDGTARLATASLPRRNARIQASYAGDADHYGSVSPVYVQSVNRAATATALAAAQVLVRGRSRTSLSATVETPGLLGVSPAGTVTFLRNGRIVGRSRLTGGTATLLLGAVQGRGRFVARFAGNPRFGASASHLIIFTC